MNSIYANIFSDRVGDVADFDEALGVHFHQVSDPQDPSNKVLRVSTIASDENLTSVTNVLDTEYNGDGGYCRFDMRFCFEHLGEISAPRYFSLELRDKENARLFSLNFEAIEYSGGYGCSKIAIKHADGTIVDGAILSSGNWYTISLEMYQDVQSRIRLSVWQKSDMLVFADTEIHTASKAVSRAAILHYSRGISGVCYFDDVSFKIGEKKYSYLTQSEPDFSGVVYDFNDGIPSNKDFNIEMLLRSGEERMLLDPATWTSVLQSEHFKRSRSFHEILLVLSGSGSYVTGGERLPFSAGSIIVCAPETSRQIISNESYRILSVTGIFEKLSFVKDVWMISDNVYGEGRKLAELILYNRFGNEDYVKSLSTAYVDYLMLSFKKPEKNTTASIYKIIEKINRHYGQSDLSVGALLEESGYTRDYIRSEFIAVTKMTPKKYLNDVRMKKAKAMIESRGDVMSFSEVAEACGIIDQSVFSRIFKKHFGVSPTQYRDSLKNIKKG